MKKTVCELFAGVGGFRCGLNHIKSIEDVNKIEKWKTVWFNQWEPAEKTTQYAHDCYIKHFGTCLDLEGKDTTNYDINCVDKKLIPDHSLLVGGFPCQDYSVAGSLATSKGLEGKKGVLWWDIREILEIKETPFCLLENVDRLIKSPAKQRGRDFAIILACFRDLGYVVEWRVINAAEYGFQQRRRRVFIFAYKEKTRYAQKINQSINYDCDGSEDSNIKSVWSLIQKNGFFAKTFPIETFKDTSIKTHTLTEEIGEISGDFSFEFDNSGVMKDGMIYSVKTISDYTGERIVLGDIIDTEKADDEYFIPIDELYYTDVNINSNDARINPLSKEQKHTWQYLKGGKKMPRKSTTGHEYLFSEGPIPMIDEYDKPARTMLTSEGGFSRTTHIVRDRITGNIRLLTAEECERIQGFPTGWTKECLVNKKIINMPIKKRRFMMGNALVVNIIEQMEPILDEIVSNEI